MGFSRVRHQGVSMPICRRARPPPSAGCIPITVIKAGRSAGGLLDAIQRGSFGQGRVVKESIPETVFKGDFDNVSFALKLSRKDLGLATELAKEYHVPMMVAGLVEQQMEEALQRG